MGKYRVLTYDTTSEGYQLLKNTLGATGIKPEGSTYVYDSNDIILNWGVSGRRPLTISMNQTQTVKVCTSKQKSYKVFQMHGVPTVTYTQDILEAYTWLRDDVTSVYVRSEDNGCMGEGIAVVKPGSYIRTDSLHKFFFTKGFPTAREFRTYVYKDTVLQVYEKKEPAGVQLEGDVRANDDWLYCKHNLQPYSANLCVEAVRAVSALGLDFGGVDIALDNMDNVCVFEVNSAPWMNATVTNKLVQAIKENYPL